MATEVLSALVVDPDGHRYDRLKTVARSLELVDPLVCRSVEQAKARLKDDGESFHIFFLPTAIERKQCADFIREAKELEGGRDSAYILLCPSHHSDPHAITARLLDGLDGFLQEPFSVEGMHEVVNLARQVMHKRASERVKAAIEVAVADLLTYVNVNASRRDSEFSKRINPRGVIRLRNTLSEIYEADKELYFEELVNAFIALAESRKKNARHTGYHGASERVRRKMQKKLLAEGGQAQPAEEQKKSEDDPQ